MSRLVLSTGKVTTLTISKTGVSNLTSNRGDLSTIIYFFVDKSGWIPVFTGMTNLSRLQLKKEDLL